MLPTKFRFIWQSGFREEDFQKLTNQKQELPLATMFLNRSGPNKQSIQRTFNKCFLPSFGSFSKAVSAEKIFRNGPIRNKNCLWRPCFLTDRDQMSNLQQMLPTNFRFIWQSDFIRGDFQKSINQKQELTVADMFVNESEQNEQFLQRTTYRSFLPSFGLFDKAVSEKKTFLEIDQSETRTACGGHICQHIETK